MFVKSLSTTTWEFGQKSSIPCLSFLRGKCDVKLYKLNLALILIGQFMWAEQIKSYNGNTVIRMFQVFENASTIMKLRLGALSVCTIIIIVLYCQAGQKISNQVIGELYRVIHEKVTSEFFFAAPTIPMAQTTDKNKYNLFQNQKSTTC
jgi:hypothetical protein